MFAIFRFCWLYQVIPALTVVAVPIHLSGPTAPSELGAIGLGLNAVPEAASSTVEENSSQHSRELQSDLNPHNLWIDARYVYMNPGSMIAGELCNFEPTRC